MMQRPGLTTMEPLHTTEFSSDRYFQKLNQQQQQSRTTDGVSSVIQPPPPLQSQFILPLRASGTGEVDETTIKSADQRRHEKSRFLPFRAKFHSKPLHTQPLLSAPLEQPLGRRAFVAGSTKQSLPFYQFFQCLPNELQIQIIASLPLSDILSLRLSSRYLHALISLNESVIVRHHLEHDIPVYARRLYPVPTGTELNLYYLCSIWHRLHVAAKLSDLMCEWITKEIFLRTTAEKRLEFAPQRERMRRRLIPLLFTIFHFFEAYRDLHLKHIIENDGNGLLREPYTLNPIEAKIMAMYDDQTLLRVHQVFPLVISSFCRRLRPPSYVGRVERSLRGYLREKPPDEVHAAILCIGGLRQVERLWEVKGYNARRAAVDMWYNGIAKDLADNDTKKRRGMLGLGRKKSPLGGAGKASSATEAFPSNASWNAWDHSSVNLASSGYVFNTSLAAGMPMNSLSKDQLKLLLPDLPVLQKIWLETAEAMILDRKIVERSADIKRNAQVMLELIREDTATEEDQWSYGTIAPESVRPNLDAIQEDVLE